MTWQRSFLAWLIIGLMVSSSVLAQTPTDFSSELPRIPARSVTAAMAALNVADSFRLELVASEPLVADPVAIAFDAQGRMFVVEMRGYSEDADAMLGRIRRLTDRDGDGRYDESVIFADQLSWPTAVTCSDGGVYVGAAPDLIYLKDTDGDGRADLRRVVFTGFGRGNVQGLVNTFKWGLDNRIHGATSSAGARLTRPNLSSPSNPIELRGRDFAWNPRTEELSPTSGGGQHGMSFNRWGEKFVCSNSDHLQQVMYDDSYLSRNPFVTPLPPRVSIASDGPQADVFRTSPVEPWRLVRTRLRVAGDVPGPIERGGLAAGYFTGATGVTIYRGHAWPAEMLDYAFVCDVGSNLIHRKKLIDEGIRYRGERVDTADEFVTSQDIWFRPVQLANAPDGTLFVVDMSREVIEHPASLPPPIKQHLDLTSGRNRGRIYRILPPKFSPRPAPNLDEYSTEALVAVLDHANGWHRETASRLIFERQDQSAVEPLRALLRDSSRSAVGRLHALWALDGLGQLTADEINQGLDDPHDHVRSHAVKLAESLAEDRKGLAKRLCDMASDPSPRVRYQLAFSLGALPESSDRTTALEQIAMQDVDSGYTMFAIQSSLGDGAGALLSNLARSAQFRRNLKSIEFLRRLAAQVRRQDLPREAKLMVRLVAEVPTDQPAMRGIVRELAYPRDSRLAQRLWAQASGVAMEQVVQQAQRVATSRVESPSRRLEAIDLLSIAPWASVRATVLSCLQPTESLDIQRAAVMLAVQYDDQDSADTFFALWEQLSPAIRTTLVDAWLERASGRDHLLAALQSERLSWRGLSPSQQQILSRQIPPDILRDFQQEDASLTSASDESLWQQYQIAWDSAGDAKQGRELYIKHCSGCHQFEGQGHAIGPNLGTMQNRGAKAIVSNVLQPNREVNPQYLAYVATTNDGRVVQGIIQNETATSLQLVAAEGKATTLLRSEIDELTSTGQSLMPTGLEQQLTPKQMRDLVAYLLHAE